MWWWRKVASREHWTPGALTETEALTRASKDLSLRPGEAGLSVFRVEDEPEGGRVADLFALTCMRKPQDLTYLLIPEECLRAIDGLVVSLAPMPVELCPYLSERHHLVNGLTETRSEQIAQTVLGDSRRRVARVRWRSLKDRAPSLLHEDPTVRPFLTDGWVRALGLA
jgi:hypothetical protein